MVMHWWVLLIQRIFMNISIMILVVWYHVVGNRRNMWGEVGWSLSVLDRI